MAYTPGQVGAAVDATRGTSDDAPDPMGRVDYTGDEFLSGPPSLGSMRAFRLAGSVESMAGPAQDTEAGQLAREHATRGGADPRRAEIDLVGAPYGPEDDTYKPAPEVTSNSRLPVNMAPQNPPERPRGGFTGADPARPAMTPRWLFMRLFDKGYSSDHPGRVEKIPQAPPRAASPLGYAEDVPGALPSPGGGFHNRREGIGAQPNSFRIMPRPWDELLINIGAQGTGQADPAQSAAAAQAARGWRL